jgi:hypothetical protein
LPLAYKKINERIGKLKQEMMKRHDRKNKTDKKRTGISEERYGRNGRFKVITRKNEKQKRRKQRSKQVRLCI